MTTADALKRRRNSYLRAYRARRAREGINSRGKPYKRPLPPGTIAEQIAEAWEEARDALSRVAGALLAARMSRGLSLTQAAERSGIDRVSFSYLERGLHLPSPEQLAKIIAFVTGGGS